MARIVISVEKGGESFDVYRNEDTFELREGETISLISESFLTEDGVCGCHFIYPGKSNARGDRSGSALGKGF